MDCPPSFPKKVSIHALLAECDVSQYKRADDCVVSIHALLAECDGGFLQQRRPLQCFNPRTPCGVRPSSLIFLIANSRVSIHALLAECDESKITLDPEQLVSIHALLAECDTSRQAANSRERVSIHALLAECDQVSFRDASIYEVSIHALLAECDGKRGRRNARRDGFNPRTPCGVRLPGVQFGIVAGQFQSTHSLRSATPVNADISRTIKSFNPRTPCGVRLINVLTCIVMKTFQSTHSLRSATRPIPKQSGRLIVSIHALLAECDSRRYHV